MTIELKKRNSGFTLVEMAIVLVIIGIILAGVMKGRDIVRGAQVKQFSQQFAQKWGTIANTYYDKTGQFLNDGTVNGGATGVDPNGVMDGATYTNAVTIINRLNAVGIAPCTLVKSKLTVGVASGTYTAPAAHCGGGTTPGTMDRLNALQTTVDGEYVANCVVSMDLVGVAATIGGQPYNRNAVVLYHVPVDVAIGLDTAIDGVANGLLGSCIGRTTEYVNTTGPTPLTAGGTVTATQWGAAVGAANAGNVQDMIILMDY